MSEHTGQDTNTDTAAIAAVIDTGGPGNTPATSSSAPAAPPSTPSAITPPATPTAPEAPKPPVSALEAAQNDQTGILAVLASKADAKSTEAGATPASGDKAAGSVPEERVAPEGGPAADPITGEDTDADPGDDDAADTDPLTPEEKAAVGSKTARKVSRLLRNVKRMEPDAKAYRNITRFMADSRLTGEDAAKGFEVMALLKAGDPRALEALQPYIDTLQRATGAILPDDLKTKVDQGYLDEESAREVAALRHNQARADALAAEQEAMVNDHRTETARTTIVSALNAWEIKQSSNPDYSALKTAVFDYAQASFAAKPPASAADAVSRIEGFYASLRRPTVAGVSRPAATRPGPSSTHSPLRPTAREPQSLAERIQLTLQRRGAA